MTISCLTSFAQDFDNYKNNFAITFGKVNFEEDKTYELIEFASIPRLNSFNVEYSYLTKKKTEVGLSFGFTDYEIYGNFLIFEKKVGITTNYNLFQINDFNISTGVGIFGFYTKSNYDYLYPTSRIARIEDFNIGYQLNIQFGYFITDQIAFTLSGKFTDKILKIENENYSSFPLNKYDSSANRIELAFGIKLRF